MLEVLMWLLITATPGAERLHAAVYAPKGTVTLCARMGLFIAVHSEAVKS
jgi:hypothetical protein